MRLEDVKLTDQGECVCASKHVPRPVSFMILESRGIVLCPTAYVNLKKLLHEFSRHGTIPSGRIRKHYSKYVQDLAADIWGA